MVKDLELVGANGALLVNGAKVSVSGLTLTSQSHGGIEVSKGVNVETNPELTVDGEILHDLVDLPIIWIDGFTENNDFVLNHELEIFVPEGKTQLWFTDKKTLIEDASVEFSFDNLTSKGTSVSDTYLTDKYTDTLLSDIIISGSVYDGNGQGSTNYANTTGLIKFGTGSKTGELKFVFNENVLIKTIIIYAAGWTASEGQLRVNGNNPAGESNLADIETRYVIVLDEATNEITIGTSSKRAFLFAVGFYGPEAEVPAAPVITEWEVSFDLGYDGSPVIKPVIVEDEKAVNEPSKPSREGYTFKGWFIGENEFDFDTLITEAITLTAHWEETEPGDEVEVTTEYIFTSKSWGTSQDDWTSGKDGNQYSSSGIQVPTGASGANGTTKITFYNVKSIEITYSTNSSSGAGTIVTKVGNETVQTFTVSTFGGTTNRSAGVINVDSLDGAITITVNCTKNSIYLYGIKIVHTES